MGPVTILRGLVGSRAHGLHTETSDYDYRGVFVIPTSTILRLGGSIQQTSWIEGKEDDTSWELGKFLLMATKSNPSILEVLCAPTVDVTPEGQALRDLFPHVWNSKDVLNAFRGYGLNQRKKFLEDKDQRPAKYAVSYLRVLIMGVELLTTGKMTMDMTANPLFETMKQWKAGVYTHGAVIDLCREMEQALEHAYSQNPDKQTNLEAVNDFLLQVRKEHW